MALIRAVLHALYRGYVSYLYPSVHFIRDPLAWLEKIAHYRATLCGGPNFAYDLLADKFDPERCAGLDLSGWRVAFNGAEPVRAATLARFAETYAATGFRPQAAFPCYGMAEATLFVSAGSLSTAPTIYGASKAALEKNEVKPGRGRNRVDMVSCGDTRLQHELCVVDPDSGIACPENRVGEIWFAGPSVACGYWNRPEQSVATFAAYLGDRGPYLRTGDLGFQRDGQLYITGRLKDLIIIRGRNFYPQDIEATVLHSHPALAPGAVAAFAVEADGGTGLVIVCEVLRSHLRKLVPEDVIAAMRTALLEYLLIQIPWRHPRAVRLRLLDGRSTLEGLR